MLLTVESFRTSQAPKYSLKLYQKCARGSLSIKDCGVPQSMERLTAPAWDQGLYLVSPTSPEGSETT